MIGQPVKATVKFLTSALRYVST